MADRAPGTSATLGTVDRTCPASGRARHNLPTVRRCLLHVVYSREVPLKHIGPVESLLVGRAGSGTEGAHHSALVMRQRVPVLIILACKSFCVIFARLNRTFLRPFLHMRQHVSSEVLEYAPAFGMRTSVPVGRRRRMLLLLLLLLLLLKLMLLLLLMRLLLL